MKINISCGNVKDILSNSNLNDVEKIIAYLEGMVFQIKNDYARHLELMKDVLNDACTLNYNSEKQEYELALPSYTTEKSDLRDLPNHARLVGEFQATSSMLEATINWIKSNLMERSSCGL